MVIERKNKYIDLLANYVHEELIDGEGALVAPLKKILSFLTYGKEVTLNVEDEHDYHRKKEGKREFVETNDEI